MSTDYNVVISNTIVDGQSFLFNTFNPTHSLLALVFTIYFSNSATSNMGSSGVITILGEL